MARAQNSGPQARVVQPVQNEKTVTLRGNVHPLARAKFDEGVVQDSQPMTKMLLVLKRSDEQEAELLQLIEEQQTRSSSNYHSWLTPEQFGKQFGPADEDIQAITGWLSAQGFSGIKVSKGRTSIEFSGNAGQVRSAFHTEVHSLSVGGKKHFANFSEPQIPSALAPVVAGVRSLHNFHPKPQSHRIGHFTRSTETGEVNPSLTTTSGCGSNNGQPCYAVGPADFAKIYNVPSSLDGTGQTIAVVGQSNINLQDVRDFRNFFGLPANDPHIVLNGPDPGIADDETEADLDVEWAGAIAPKATVKLVVSESTFSDLSAGVELSAIYIVDNNIAGIMSESYGACEAGIGSSGNAFYNSLWQQAAAQGITVILSSGDSGSAGCDDPNSENVATSGLGISGLASTPFNIAAGGTDFDDVSSPTTYWNTSNNTTTKLSAKSYIPESTWNNSCAASGLSGCTSATIDPNGGDLVAAGGGASSIYSKPTWQNLGITGMPSDNARDIPDISLFASSGANNHFYVVCEADAVTSNSCSSSGSSASFLGVGGTSLSAPAFAGIMALVNQQTGSRQGNANYILYHLAKNETYANCNSSSSPSSGCVFYDTTKGNISVACAAGSPDCSKTGSSGNGVVTTTTGGSTVAYSAGTGYDRATGLGSVNVANLVNAWSSISLTGSSTALHLNGGTSTISVAHGTSVTVNINVTPSGATGPVSLIGGPSSPLGIDSFVLSGGAVNSSTNGLPGGTYSVSANYGGDSTYAASTSNSVNVVVTRESSKTAVALLTCSTNCATAVTSAAYGSPYILRVDVTNASGQKCSTAAVPCPTGTISLTDNSSALDGGSFSLNSVGYFEDQPIQLSAGTHNVVATYAGDSSFSGSTSATDTITITPAVTSTATVPSTSSITSGGSLTLTATVSSNSNSVDGPSGTVQFLVGGSNLGAAATCTPAGASSSAGASCTARLTTTLSSLPPEFIPVGPPSAPFAVLTWLAAALAIIGFLLGSKLTARRRPYAYAGLAFFLMAALALAGCGGGGSSGSSSRSITAHYSGDTNYAASTSNAVTVTVH